MNVKVYTDRAGAAKEYKDALNVYQKGSFICIEFTGKLGKRAVDKYPIRNIFRISQDYE